MEQILDGYTRVSEILQIFQGYAHVPIEKLRKAQDVGTEVHLAVEEFFKNEFPAVSKGKSGYIVSFMKFYDKFKPKPILNEIRLYDESNKITGRLDMLAEIDGVPVILDWKTGSWAHPEIWRLQGAFYSRLLVCNNHPEPARSIFVQLKKDGSDPDIFGYERSDLDWVTCCAAIHMYKYFKGFDLNSRLF